MTELTVREHSREDIIFTIYLDNVPYSITDKKIKLIRVSCQDVEDIFSIEDDASILEITDGDNGEFTMHPAVNTWVHPGGMGFYDMYVAIEICDIYRFWPESLDIRIHIKD